MKGFMDRGQRLFDSEGATAPPYNAPGTPKVVNSESPGVGAHSSVGAGSSSDDAHGHPLDEGSRERWVRLALAAGLAFVVVFLSFNSGSFYPGTTGLAATLAALALILRVTLAGRPFRGLGRGAAVVAAPLALLAVLTLVSSAWSHSAARAVADFDRVLLYLELFVLGASLARTDGRLRAALAGTALGIVVVVGAGVVSRVLPDVLHTRPDLVDERLSYPLSYWNGFGLLAVVGIVLCTHLSCAREGNRLERTLAAAALPVLAAAVVLTLSRGSVAAAVLGLVAYAVVARPRTGPLVLLAAGIPAGVAVWASTRASELTSHPRSGEALHQGHRLALVLAACVVAAAVLRWAAALVLDDRLAGAEGFWRGFRLALPVVLVVVLVGAVLAGAPGAVSRFYHGFVDERAVTTQSASRFLDPGANGRIDHWRVALRNFRRHPVIGSGAGTYEVAWLQHRRTPLTVVNAHSMFLGLLSDLGLLGGGLLVLALVAMGAGLLLRARRARRALYGAVFAAGLTWTFGAGIDWDWELPATTAWLFPLAGLALARPAVRAASVRAWGNTMRLVTGIALLVLAITPALMALSQAALDSSVAAFRANNCPAAISHALDVSKYMGPRPEPYEVLGFCDVQLGQPGLGAQQLQRAVDRDPNYWEYQYGLAIVRGAAGLDPRPAARQALELNPFEPLAQEGVRRFRKGGPSQWRREALKAPLPPS